ncbi:Uncharacterized protein BM_BM17502 [Brugia malayi]|uniref:Uncharacterized protein n=1 Tax=Brugia malayi TaxID=6279 RepID=A0A4E9FA71_BRUMA|nr:Uncharacterized protein BM_BM17502 [Brugia malayi]VIO93747.1 Uncharacterized protein BM_BM17502 [Brugia malayi]
MRTRFTDWISSTRSKLKLFVSRHEVSDATYNLKKTFPIGRQHLISKRLHRKSSFIFYALL